MSGRKTTVSIRSLRIRRYGWMGLILSLFLFFSLSTLSAHLSVREADVETGSVIDHRPTPSTSDLDSSGSISTHEEAVLTEIDSIIWGAISTHTPPDER